MVLEKKIEEEAKKIQNTEKKKTLLENEENNLLDQIKKTTIIKDNIIEQYNKL